MTPTALPPPGTPSANPTFTALGGNSGLFVDPSGGTTHSANAAEQNQYGHWGAGAFDVGGSGFGSPGSGGGGAGPGLGIYDPKFAYVGNHGVK